MIREPAVAGKFYTGDADLLREELSALVPQGTAERVLGIIAPHAGYMYSGKVAGKVYGAIRVPDTVLVLGPNHTGLGAPAALSPAGDWLTPLGTVPIDAEFSKLILEHAPVVHEDLTAHRFEHSLEVQLPFLQHKNPKVSIAALCLSLLDLAALSRLSEGLVRAIKALGREVLIVASSDMTHYESAKEAKAKDDLALSEVAHLNPEGLVKVCRQQDITMCGVIPAAVMLMAAKSLGASSSRLVAYATSGEANGDFRRVVAYAGVTVS